MSGFESMSSNYNCLLHPPVDPSDAHDPTFLGITRKRRVEAPKTEFYMDERGKRINVAMTRHHPENIWQLESQFKPETFCGDTRSTRFGRGFVRRPGSIIACDAQRKAEEAVSAQAHAEAAVRRRLQAVARDSATNPITGEAPAACKFFGVSPGSCGSGPPSGRTRRTGKGTSQRALQTGGVLPIGSSVAATAGSCGGNDSGCVSKRHQLLATEGLTVTRKAWGAKEQLQSFDGFALPQIGTRNTSDGEKPRGRRCRKN